LSDGERAAATTNACRHTKLASLFFLSQFIIPRHYQPCRWKLAQALRRKTMLWWQRFRAGLEGFCWTLKRNGLRADIVAIKTLLQQSHDLAHQDIAAMMTQLQQSHELAHQRTEILSGLRADIAGMKTLLLQSHELAHQRTEVLSGLRADIAAMKTLLQQSHDLAHQRTQVLGHSVFLDPADRVVGPALLQDGCFEPLETSLISREIKLDNVVLDVGANIGYYTLIFARLVGPEGKVFAFEPDPDNFRLLKKNVRANGYNNVVFVNKAVADRSGVTRLFVCPDNKGDHRLYDSGDGRRSIDVDTVALDDYFADYQGAIDFIKVDIQGSEAAALRGMRGLLDRNQDVKLVTEFWPFGLIRGGAEAANYLDELCHHGFQLQEIDETKDEIAPVVIEDLLRRYVPETEDFTNLYCVRKAA
jgi:FkbM family methyltransferase